MTGRAGEKEAEGDWWERLELQLWHLRGLGLNLGPASLKLCGQGGLYHLTEPQFLHLQSGANAKAARIK